MGSKGQSTSNQQQSQTYTPNPQAQSAIMGALGQAQNTASLPFNIPQAPVAGFSQDQQQGFQGVRNAQGSAQPYFNQANNYFQQGTQADVSQFFNPLAGAVGSQLQNIFGQQNLQNTANLTQAAGGVGADRIAVGQANMANQQGLAAGQTFANLYQPALQAAQQQESLLQGAGYGSAALGSAVQNSQLTGANALLGTGGLQQQYQQALLNSPYQQQLAQAAFPYQQSQFLTNAVGSLAPGLGGTTSGYGTSTNNPAQPSIWSQILGGAGVGTALYNGFGGSKGTGTGTAVDPGSIYNTGNGQISGGGPTGPTPFYAEGGEVGNPYGAVSDAPINIAGGILPQGGGQDTKIAPHIPQLNFSQPQQGAAAQSQGPSLGDIAKLATMFMARGGQVGDRRFDGFDPQAFFRGGAPGYDDGGDVINPDEPYRMPDASAVKAWRRGVDADIGAGETNVPLPKEITGGQPDAASAGLKAYADAGSPYSPKVASAAPQVTSAKSPPVASAAPHLIDAPEQSNPAQDFAKSPWAPLLSASLGIMGGTSPYAGVNIGQGGLQGMKALEQQRADAQKDTTIKQSAQRLAQEAKFHEDAYNRETLNQKKTREHQEKQDDLAERRFNRPYNELTKVEQAQVDEQKQRTALEGAKPFKIGTDRSGYDIMGVRDPNKPGGFIDAVTGKPVDPSRLRGAVQQPAAAAEPDGTVPANNATVAAGAYNYAEGAPTSEKGMDVPEPAAVGGHSARGLQTDAEYYLQTGKLPPGPRGGKSPTAIEQNDYVNAVRNYAGVLATSRGLTPEQTADMWRSSPGMLRFILGQDGRSTVALGTAVRHLDTLRQYAEAWKANDMQTVNRLRSVISREFGGSAATNLESAGKIVGPEIMKALGVAGAGTSEERHNASEQFSAIKSPEQMAGAIGVTQRLLGGQLEGRKRQASAAGLNEERFKNLVGDRPYEILSTIDKPGQPGTGASSAQSPPAAAALPDQAKAQLKEGQVTTFGNGQKWTLRNGQPAQVQ